MIRKASFVIAALIPFSAFAADDSMNTPRNDFKVSYEDVERAVAHDLTNNGVGDKVSATMTGHKSTPVFVYGKAFTVETRGLTFDKATSRWNASLLFIADGDVITAMPASGIFNELIELPVLKREIRSGEIISAADIELRDYPANRMRNDVISDLSSLVGKAPIRSISQNRPIRSQEVGMPSIVRKNSLVTMRYLSPGMEITANGQAMDDGAKGDVIAVRNMNSKKIIRAVIDSSDTVTIVGADTQTSQLTGAPYAAN